MARIKLSTFILTLALSGKFSFASSEKDLFLEDANGDYCLSTVYRCIHERLEFPINDVIYHTIESLFPSQNMPTDLLKEAINGVVHRDAQTVEESLALWRDEYPKTVNMIGGLYEALYPHNGAANVMQPSAYQALKDFIASRGIKTFEDYLKETKDEDQYSIASVYMGINEENIPIYYAMLYLSQDLLSRSKTPENVVALEIISELVSNSLELDGRLAFWTKQYPRFIELINEVYKVLSPHYDPESKNMRSSAYEPLKTFLAGK